MAVVVREFKNDREALEAALFALVVTKFDYHTALELEALGYSKWPDTAPKNGDLTIEAIRRHIAEEPQ